MPIRTIKRDGKTCYQWGNSGKVYCGPGARKKAGRQAAAAYANGYRGDGGGTALRSIKKKDA